MLITHVCRLVCLSKRAGKLHFQCYRSTCFTQVNNSFHRMAKCSSWLHQPLPVFAGHLQGAQCCGIGSTAVGLGRRQTDWAWQTRPGWRILLHTLLLRLPVPRLLKHFLLPSYASCCLPKYMEKHKVPKDGKAFQLVSRFYGIAARMVFII